MLRCPPVRRPYGLVTARLLPAGTRRSACRARSLLAAHIAEKADEPVDHGRVVRDQSVWPLYWARTAKHQAGCGILLVLPEDLPPVADAEERGHLLQMMEALAPVWTQDYRVLAPSALRYLLNGTPNQWAREMEMGDQ